MTRGRGRSKLFMISFRLFFFITPQREQEAEHHQWQNFDDDGDHPRQGLRMAQNGVLCVDGFIDRNIDGATLPADRQRYGMNIIHRLVDHAPRLIGRESVSEASQTWREADRICGSDSIRSIGRAFLKQRRVKPCGRPSSFPDCIAGAGQEIVAFLAFGFECGTRGRHTSSGVFQGGVNDFLSDFAGDNAVRTFGISRFVEIARCAIEGAQDVALGRGVSSGNVHRRRQTVEIVMLLRLQGGVAAEHRCQEPARASDANQKQNDAEPKADRSFMHFTRMRGVAERHMPASAEKDCDHCRRDERQLI